MACSISFRFYSLLVFLFVLHIGITMFTASGVSVNDNLQRSNDSKNFSGLSQKLFSTAMKSKNGISLCPEHFVRIGLHCYYFSTEKANSWSDSKALCEKTSSSNLAIIRDPLDNYLIQKHMNESYANIPDLEGWWIAGTDVVHHGHWKWNTSIQICETIKYFDWCPGEPNDYGQEHCLSLLPQCQFRWNDRDCGFWGFRYICQTFMFPRPDDAFEKE